MARINLVRLDHDENVIDTVMVESDESPHVNSYVTSPDGGLYLICAVADREPPFDFDVTGIWIDGPDPRPRAS